MSSSKRNDDLCAYQVAEMENLIDLGELETGSGANQIGTLKQEGVIGGALIMTSFEAF